MEMKELRVCCICGQTFLGWGNSPWPISEDDNEVCCNYCNLHTVLPARLKRMEETNNEK